MFLPFLLLLQTTAPSGVMMPTMEEVRLDECLALAASDPQSGIVDANEWSRKNGGWRARQCLGFAYHKQGNHKAATDAFAKAVTEAQSAGSDTKEVGKLRLQAGNAALVAGDIVPAITHFNTAIGSGAFTGEALGEIYIDRARANGVVGDMAAAKADLAKAHELVPQDPLGWLLSATLARREGDVTRARADIAIAAKLAAKDPAIALEAGNIAVAAQDYAGARTNWQAAVDLAPASPYAATAKGHLKELDAMEGEAKGAVKPAAPSVPQAKPAAVSR